MIRRVLALLFCLAALTACSSSSSPSSSHASDLNDNNGGVFQGAEIDPAQPRPQFTLTDTAGKPFAFGTSTSGHPTLLYFGYTQCPDVCPEIMADASVALSKLPASLVSKTYVVFVTTDPQHDTGPIIKKWLSYYLPGNHAHWVGLRGTQAQLDTAESSAHVMLSSDGGKTHSAILVLYGPDDYAHDEFLQSTTEQQQIQHDLPLVAQGRT